MITQKEVKKSRISMSDLMDMAVDYEVILRRIKRIYKAKLEKTLDTLILNNNTYGHDDFDIRATTLVFWCRVDNVILDAYNNGDIKNVHLRSIRETFKVDVGDLSCAQEVLLNYHKRSSLHTEVTTLNSDKDVFSMHVELPKRED